MLPCLPVRLSLDDPTRTKALRQAGCPGPPRTSPADLAAVGELADSIRQPTALGVPRLRAAGAALVRLRGPLHIVPSFLVSLFGPIPTPIRRAPLRGVHLRPNQV